MTERKEINNIWIGSIPKTWQDKKFKYVTKFLNGYAFKSDEYVPEGIPVIRIGDIKPEIDLVDTKRLSESYLEIAKDFIIKKNDILIALTGATIGKSSVYDLYDIALLNQRVAVIRTLEIISNNYLKYLIDSVEFKSFINYECDGGAQENIGKEDIGNFVLPVPSLEEQTAIANYLDEKTAQIDKLIAGKQALIDLMKEERTAIINNAVTKGINPKARLKSTGIEWLGDIPEHWEIKKLKWFFKLSRGFDLSSNQFIEGDYPVYGSNGVIGYHNEFNVTGPGITVGRSGSVGEVNFIETNFWAHNTCLYVEKNYGSDWKFGFYFLKNMDLKALSSGSVVGTLNRNYIHDELIGFPPLPEQHIIVKYIEIHTSRIDTTISKIEKEIELMQEYRTALISEVVTGKIKVI